MVRLFTKLPHLLLTLFLLAQIQLIAQPTFINKLPIPPLIVAGNDPIQLEMRPAFHKFNPGNLSDTINGTADQPKGISTFAYNIAGDTTMSILGPTMKWIKGQPTHIMVTNLFADYTTTHWHGAEVPAMFDGGPHQHFHFGETWESHFMTLDNASTLWYHPHLHDETLPQVQMGLSGMTIVEDPNDPIRNTLPHTYGVDDLPIIFGDFGLTKAASSTTYTLDTLKGKRPYNIVNGVNSPYLEVPAHWVRLRMLNGSTRKGIQFGFTKKYTDPLDQLIVFQQIATDGGYTLEPVPHKTMVFGPGAREEVLIDLSGFSPGDKLYLRNLKELLPAFIVGSPQTGPNGGGKDVTLGNAFLELRIVSDDQFPGYIPITSFTPFSTNWGTPELENTSNIARTRTKELRLFPGIPNQTPNQYMIDSTTYNLETINDTICVNTKEIWTIKNTSNVAHPFHIHKIQFRVLEVDSAGTKLDLASHGFLGPKDDILILPKWSVSFLGYFKGYPTTIEPVNTYMYHCHILTHEDHEGGGMMHQFVVTDEGDCLGMNATTEPGEVSHLQITPNPAAGVFTFAGYADEPSRLVITGINGQVVSQQMLAPINGPVQTDIADLSNGVYTVSWYSRQGIATGKLVVLK